MEKGNHAAAALRPAASKIDRIDRYLAQLSEPLHRVHHPLGNCLHLFLAVVLMLFALREQLLVSLNVKPGHGPVKLGPHLLLDAHVSYRIG